MKRRVLLSALVLLMSMSMVLAGCGSSDSTPTNNENQASQGNTSNVSNGNDQNNLDKVQVYTTLFALTSFAEQIGGEYVEVHAVIPPGAEAHGYEPTMKEMVEMEKADLFIYNGGGFETWVERLLGSINTSNMLIVESVAEMDLMEGGHAHGDEEGTHEEDHGTEEGTHEEETHEGDEHGDGEATHDEHGEDKHDAHDHGPFDPHVWLDPLLAMEQAKQVKDALIQVDPTHQGDYEKNYDALVQEIEAIHHQYETTIATAMQKKFVVSHAAFGYLAERYGLEQVSIRGISPDHEPTPNELVEIVKTVKEAGIKAILVEEFVSKKSAEVLANETGATVMTINTIGNITAEQAEKHVTYQDLMLENLEALKIALEIK
ncbi:metal ABC transporter solute-binding protein, Zn/Mn family [Rubeoparvulum massiliense]|uniref:metal ABC transporter solute-binding protein, Zn/Mn family n=1 Tax=Rubeoparvulum massiliense TaxID=1631346 RepID=UPI00065E8C42|nr:zinc ABC transporter substrate-binding protein [Rubeoparvulum massiliense]